MSTTRTTFRHASVYTLAAVLGKMISFFLLPFYTHVLGDVGYGVIGMVETSLALLMSLMSFGVQSAVIRFYHDRPEGEKKLVVSTGVRLAAGVSTALVLPVLLLSRPLAGLFLDDSSSWLYLCLAMVGFVLELTGMAASSILLIERRSMTFSAIGLLRLFIGVGTSVWFVLVLDWGLFGYFLSSVVTTSVSTSCFLYIAWRRCGTAWDRDVARDLVRFQLPLVPGNLASFVSRQIERVLVKFMLGIENVGVLEIGYKFPSLISIIISQPFMKSWNTTRTEMADEPGAHRHIGQVFTWYLLLVVSGGLVLAVNIPTVIHLITPPEFWAADRIARIEVLTMILQGCYWHVGFGLYYSKETRLMAVIRGVSSAVKVGLSVLFINLWGLFGAAWSAALINMIVLVWGGVVSQRRYAIGYEWKKLVFIGVTSGTAYAVLSNLDLSSFSVYEWFRVDALPGLAHGLDGTALGAWKDGKLVRMLGERNDLVADLLVRTALCLPYALLIPALHWETRRKILKRLRLR